MKSVDEVAKGLEGLPVELKKLDEKTLEVRVKSELLVEVATKLKEIGFDHVKSVTGIDRPTKEEIEVVYHVSSYEGEVGGLIVVLRTSTKRTDPRVPSLTEVWASAEYLERETYDMLGVIFEGHPRMERLLLLPDEFEGIYPLRKDFKVPEEGLVIEDD